MPGGSEKTAAVRDITVAICGNPNCGKTTLFNALTGMRQRVGNYPGVTVERTSGTLHLDSINRSINLIDIPGTYSLAATSPDEYVATCALCGSVKGETCPDLIVCVVDASNLERSLYLLMQVAEVGPPMIVALNKIDVAARRGLKIDVEALSRELNGLPVVPVVASKGEGIAALKEGLAELYANPIARPVRAYHPLVNSLAEELAASTNNGHGSKAEYLRLLFDRSGPAEKALVKEEGTSVLVRLNELRQRLSDRFGSLSAGETAPLSNRATEICLRSVVAEPDRKPTRSERVDRVLLHPVLGPLFFLAVMVLMFQTVFSWAEPAMNLIELSFGHLAGLTAGLLDPGPLRSLIVNGVIGGVGSVLIFLPQIIILFLFITVLEDSGYMPRAAFLVDRLLGWCGLSGKSFVPMLSSFACAVPGIMAARTIENRKLRVITILVSPLMSCSARLPIYTIMIAAFIPHLTFFGFLNLPGLVLTALYLVGLLLAVLVSYILSLILGRGETSTFLMDMPSYAVPSMKSITIRITGRVKSFLARAGSMIMAITVIIWAVSYYPHTAEVTDQFAAQTESVEARFKAERIELSTAAAAEGRSAEAYSVTLANLETEQKLELSSLANEEAGAHLRNSYLGQVGRMVAPAFAPLGWDWKITMATLAAFPAREVVVATMGTIYNLGTDEGDSSVSLAEKMRGAKWEEGSRKGEPVFSPPVALSIMMFFALCAQCGATLVTIKHETGRWAYAFFAFGYMSGLAYLAAWVVYRGSLAMGW